MAYLVNVLARAERDLEEIYSRVNADSSATAFRWFNGLERAMLTLEENPSRCPLTIENKRLRHLLYGKKPDVYRIIYQIDAKSEEVDIIHIRHGARGAFQAEDLM